MPRNEWKPHLTRTTFGTGTCYAASWRCIARVGTLGDGRSLIAEGFGEDLGSAYYWFGQARQRAIGLRHARVE